MDDQQTAFTLKDILAKIVSENGNDPRQIDLQTTFAELGVNSVDLLEFVLRLEEGFGVRVLDDMLPDELPASLAAWVELLRGRLDSKAAA
jgi:acyl carrier protein